MIKSSSQEVRIEDIPQGAKDKFHLASGFYFLCEVVLTLGEERLGKEVVKEFLIGG